MTNALATLDKSEIELTTAQELIMAESQNDGDAFDVVAPRLKMPSGGALFFDLDGEPLKEVDCIIAISQKSRAYWPDSETMGKAPLCSSPDGSTGLFNQEDEEQTAAADLVEVKHPAIGLPIEDAYDCRQCPLAKFGSSPKGAGQACKSLRRLVLVIDGYTVPVLATLPPTSLRAFDSYASAQKSKRSAYFACRTKMTLDEKVNGAGIKYAVVKFEKIEDITDDDTLLAITDVRQEYRELIATLNITADEYDAS